MSFAVSAAKDAIGGNPELVKIYLDRDTYKHSISVDIPGTQKMGLSITTALGAVCGDSRLGPEVLKT